MSDKAGVARHGKDVESGGAYILRENTGTTGLEQTVRLAASRLADHEIPHLIAGGLAVQEHGYLRVTRAADIIVPDVLEAVEWLTADLSGPFKKLPDIADTVCHERTGVQINFLPAGKVLRAKCRVPFPEPKTISEAPRFVSLEQLVALKLDSWSVSPNSRLKDKADVVELIKALKLPRDLAVAEPVRALYTETWDALQAER